MDKFNTYQVTMGIKKSIKQQNSKQKRLIAPKSKEFCSWILQKVIDNGKNSSLNIWILDDPKIWGTHLNRREVVMYSEPAFFKLCFGKEGVDEKNIPNRTTKISMFLYIKLAQQNTSTIDIIFKPFVKRDNSLLGNPICKIVSIFYGEIDQKIVWIDKL